MKCIPGICKFCREYLWVISGVLSVIAICICSEDSDNTKLLNISYSVFATVLFHLLLVFVPNRRKRLLAEELINSDFFKLKESARLCRESIEAAFSFGSCNWKSKDEYVKQFCSIDLYEVWRESNGKTITRLGRIEGLRDEMKDTIDHLMMYRECLNMDEFETLARILSSKLFYSPIEPIDWGMPEEIRTYKSDNQKEIGESIYEVYNLLRILNQKNKHENN